MRLVILLYLISVSSTLEIFGTPVYQSNILYTSISNQEDSLQKLQLLYRGVIWTNKYRRFNGDQFFLTPMFIPGTVSINGRTYKNLRIKYDIYSDELIIPLNMEEIIQLNKEMIDSFSLSFENKTYRFINSRNDSISGLNGYCCLLYSGKSALYVKYKKSISTAVTITSDGEFNQTTRIYFGEGDLIYPVKSTGDLLKILGGQKEEIRNYISKNKLKVSKNDPGSFIPVIKYYDSLSN
jgi:hypothetical protein